MSVIVGYDNGAKLTYSLNAFNAWEGYSVAFNGTRGRLEHTIVEMYKQRGVEVERAGIMAAFGCNFEGDIPVSRVVELVQSGAIGAVTEAHVWVGRAWGLQSAEDAKKHGDIVSVTERPAEAQTPSPELSRGV